MKRLLTLSLVLASILLADNAYASSSIEIKDFEYDYTNDGRPIARVILSNQGREVESLDVSIDLRTLYSRAQATYHSKVVDVSKTNTVIEPGQEQTVTVTFKELVPSGEAEAIVSLDNTSSRFDFYVKDIEYIYARSRRNGVSSSDDPNILYLVLAFVVTTAIAVIPLLLRRLVRKRV